MYLEELCLFVLGSGVRGVEITYHSEDVLAVVGDQARLSCGVERSRENRFNNCSWVGPDRGVWWADQAENRGNVFVERDQDFYYCVLEINSLKLEDQGVWNCVIKDDERIDKAKTKFIFVNIGGKDGPEILLNDYIVVEAVEGEETSMICPTSIRPRSNQDRPTCIWLSPTGRKYDIIGRKGEIYVHEKEGLSAGGMVDEGDCGIKINKVQENQRGLWTCRVLTIYGQDLLTLEHNVTLEVQPRKVHVTKPLHSGRMAFSLDIVRDREDQVHNVFWILRRETVLTEGKTVCFAGRSSCVTSSSLQQQSVKDDKIFYQMKITYDEVSKEDSNHPVVLVIEWRDTQGKDQSEHIFLDNVGSSNRRISRVIGDSRKNALCGGGCTTNSRKLLDGEFIEDKNLCIKIRCDGGDVLIESLNNCQLNSKNDDSIVFPGDFS